MRSVSGGFRRSRQVLVAALGHFNESDGWAMSSHVAFSLMLAIFPFLIFAMALAGFLDTSARANDIIALAFGYWPDEIAAPIEREIEVVLGHGNLGFLTLGIGLALFFASNGVEAARVALNRAYGDKDKRNPLLQRIQSVAFVVVIALLIAGTAGLLVTVPNLGAGVVGDLLAGETSRLIFSSMILVGVLVACHLWLPGHNRTLRQVWPGIALTTAFWVLSAKLFAHYVSSISDYSTTYAGLAGIMTAQIFLYLMAVIFILGAEINAILEQRVGADSGLQT